MVRGKFTVKLTTQLPPFSFETISPFASKRWGNINAQINRGWEHVSVSSLVPYVRVVWLVCYCCYWEAVQRVLLRPLVLLPALGGWSSEIVLLMFLLGRWTCWITWRFFYLFIFFFGGGVRLLFHCFFLNRQ